MLELNGNSSYCKILRYSNWTSDGALDNNNCNYYNNNHSTPRLEVRPVPEEGCYDVPAAVPDPAQGDKQDRAELQAEEPTGSNRTSPPSEGGRAPPPPAMTPPPPPWAQPRQCGSLPCDFWLVNQWWHQGYVQQRYRQQFQGVRSWGPQVCIILEPYFLIYINENTLVIQVCHFQD